MATEEPMQRTPEPAQDTPMSPSAELAPPEGAEKTKKRPRLDMAVEPRERKRGKTMFGLVLGTLTKAKNEDKERNASDAAKKDKTTANRKEEDLQLKDSIHKLRRTRLPLLSNFLLTSDVIPSADSDTRASTNPLAAPPKTRPPPLYYLPAKLLPSQEAFLQRRKEEVQDAAEKEWDEFKTERTAGVEEISLLRERVAEESRRKTEHPEDADENGDAKMAVEGDADKPHNGGMNMDVDEVAEKEKEGAAKDEKKADVTPPGPGYDDDAVEY
uniref:Glutamyl-tRNA synthetase (EC) n=1 Tax=Ganoderma boninense TaxID=34458 RepID=A0A5K1JUX9_9APHY|nr:Glutamyl-tRNA synthetase (EC [Ganoderma boninense]